MNLFDPRLLKAIAFPKNKPFYYTRIKDDSLSYSALIRNVLVLGKPDMGKTEWVANHTIEYAKAFPNRAIVSIDLKGSETNKILKGILLQEPEDRDALTKRVRLDAFGDPNYVLPTPSFVVGKDPEEQVQRVVSNLKKLHPDLMEKNPTMGEMPITDTGTNIFRLLAAIRDELGECWQPTEAKRLIMEPSFRTGVINRFGGFAPIAKSYFEDFFDELSNSEQYRRTSALISVLQAVEPPFVRAKIGYPKPAVTMEEVIQKGLIYLIDGSGLANYESSLDFLTMDAWTSFMYEINKRIPDDPKDDFVSLLADEAVNLFGRPTMAPEIAAIPSQMRSRKLQFYIALQELNQVSRELRPSLWSFGNVVCFSMANVDEAKEIARQLFPFIPILEKLPAARSEGQPIVATSDDQYTIYANQIQRLRKRECIIRYYKNSGELDKYIHWCLRTTESKKGDVDVWSFRQELLKEHGIPLRTALKEINGKSLGGRPKSLPTFK